MAKASIRHLNDMCGFVVNVQVSYFGRCLNYIHKLDLIQSLNFSVNMHDSGRV